MATEKQNEANQANSQHSTGPKTEEGKDESRRNALKTGLFGMGFILPQHLETEVLETYGWLVTKINPENALEHGMTMGLARHLVLFGDAGRLQIFHKMKVAQRTLLYWDDDQKLAAAEISQDLTREPVVTALRLANSKAGCTFLLGLWDQFHKVLDATGAWTDAQQARAYDLLGIDPALRGPGGVLDVPEGVDLKTHFQSVYQGEVARLTALRDGPLQEIDATEREQAMLGHLPNDQELKNYERGERSQLNQMLKLIKVFELSLGRPGLGATIGFPRKAVGETREEFNERVHEYRDLINRAQEQDRARADAERRRKQEEAAEAERNRQPEFAPGMDFEAFLLKMREWHQRIHVPIDNDPTLQGLPASLRFRMANDRARAQEDAAAAAAAASKPKRQRK